VVCAIPIDDDHRNVKLRGHKSLGLSISAVLQIND